MALLLIVRLSPVLGVAALAGASVLAIRARRSFSLARRSGVGANSEDQVRLVLRALLADGWSVRASIALPRGGDVDHLAVSPAGAGFVIETKTRSFSPENLQRTLRAARWAARHGRAYPHSVIPVLCVVRSSRLEHFYGEVLVVSLDRLVPALRSAASRGRVAA